MRRMRVVHLVEGLALGGLERVVAGLVRHADLRRTAVEVIAAVRGGEVAAEIAAAGASVTVLGLKGYRPADVLALARVLRRRRVDVVHSHGHFAGVLGRSAAWWSGAPAAVHHLHTMDPTLRTRHLRLERVLARVTRRVICCSAAVARHAVEVMRLPADLTVVVPNGIDPPPAADRAAALRAIGSPAPPVLGCVGSLTAHKGQAVLLRAAAALPRSACGTVVLIGDGPERGALEALAAAIGLSDRVRFAGARPDARALLPAFDVAVVPSTEREGMPLAALEAMDAGLPLVASRLGGLCEVIEHERSGLLVPPGDPAALAGALRAVLEQPGRARSLGEAARRSVETCYRAALMARRVEAIEEEALHVRFAA